MMSKTIRTPLVLALIAAMLVVMTACGGNTLEKYFNEHPEEAKEVEKAMNASGNGLMECSFSAKENTANYILKFTKTYSESDVAQLKNALEKQCERDNDRYVSMIKQMEESTGLEGITCHIEYQNGDGSVIFETDISQK